MGKSKHKYNTRSTSGQKKSTSINQETGENSNLTTTADKIQHELENIMDAMQDDDWLSKHVNKKRGVRESFEAESEVGVSNVVMTGPSVSYVAKPRTEILDGGSSDG